MYSCSLRLSLPTGTFHCSVESWWKQTSFCPLLESWSLFGKENFLNFTPRVCVHRHYPIPTGTCRRCSPGGCRAVLLCTCTVASLRGFFSMKFTTDDTSCETLGLKSLGLQENLFERKVSSWPLFFQGNIWKLDHSAPWIEESPGKFKSPLYFKNLLFFNAQSWQCSISLLSAHRFYLN